MRQHNNPDRLSQAAHSFRELIDNCPECAGQQVVNVAGGAANVLRKIDEDFQQIERSSPAAASGWEGTIDPPLRAAILRIRERITEYYLQVPSRSKQAQSTYDALVPGAKAMPVIYQKQNSSAWLDLRRFFNNVAHHIDRSVTEADFLARVAEFEQMALAQLAPSPTDDMNKIDQLIEDLGRV